jgi:hypothetical protein
LTCSRRFGSKPTSNGEIRKAYEDLARKSKDVVTGEGLMFRNIVVLIEFLRDLDAVVLAMNFLTERDFAN